MIMLVCNNLFTIRFQLIHGDNCIGCLVLPVLVHDPRSVRDVVSRLRVVSSFVLDESEPHVFDCNFGFHVKPVVVHSLPCIQDKVISVKV